MKIKIDEKEIINPQISIEQNLERGARYLIVEMDGTAVDYFPKAPVKSVQAHFSVPELDHKHMITGESWRFVVNEFTSTPFSLSTKRFTRYREDFPADDRVMLEFMIMKQRYAQKRKNQQFFQWSYSRISQEAGIKRKRAEKIISKFENKLGFLQKIPASKTFEMPKYKLDYKKLAEVADQVYDSGSLEEGYGMIDLLSAYFE